MFRITVDEHTRLELLDYMHAQDLFDLTIENSDYLAQWLPWVGFVSTVKDTEFFIKTTKQQWKEDNGFQCAIFYKDCLCGAIGFHEFDADTQSASIGYWLGEKYQGLGLVTSSLRVLIQTVFEHYNIRRCIVRCAKNNEKSRKVPEKLGFTLDGIIRENEKVNDTYLDHAVYTLLKNEELK